MILKRCALLFIMLTILKLTVNAQSIPVGTPALDDYYRRLQLLGQTDSSASFTSRPFSKYSK